VAEIDEKRGADGDDAELEAIVLRQLLLLHPAQLTVEELVVDIAVERAVRELARSGLLHRSGEFAIPSRAALRFNELLSG